MSSKDTGSGTGKIRREQVRAVEEGIDIVRDAIRDFLKKPKAEREKHLATLSTQLEAFAENLDDLPSGRAGTTRLEATRRIVEILKTV